MSEPTAQVSREIDASPEIIWAALTTPAKLKQFFFGADVRSDFQVGSPIRMSGVYDNKSYEDRGEILEAQRAERLSFTHWSGLSGLPDKPENYHVVTFDLTPSDRGTKVTLTQSNLEGGVTDADRKQCAQFEKNWTQLLEGLAKTVAD